ncbi:MAG: hypothetical protein BWY54_00767 [Candidatus Dependentiae bacterium ADurb.Bin331]|nr:MAG: hypothetical protein BWY54_00767 [Candidatus Dependentiae bacterium ADurb.Bin331]
MSCANNNVGVGPYRSSAHNASALPMFNNEDITNGSPPIAPRIPSVPKIDFMLFFPEHKHLLKVMMEYSVPILYQQVQKNDLW